MKHSVLVDVDAMGHDAAREAQLLAETLDALDRIAHETGLLVWSHELGRVVDPTADAEAIRSLGAAAARPASHARLKGKVIAIAIAVALAMAAWSWFSGRA